MKLQKKFKKRQVRFQSGITLIEIIVVIAIVLLLLSLGIGVLTDWFEAELSKTASELAGTIQYVYNEAAIKNKYYRLKIDFSNQSFSVEASPNAFKIENSPEGVSAPSSENLTPNEASSHPQENPEQAPSKQEGFSQVSSYLLKPIRLPEGIRIKDVSIAHANKKIENGVAAIYFFPNGWVEKAIINLCDDKEENFYSLEIHSLTGKTTIRNGYFDDANPK